MHTIRTSFLVLGSALLTTASAGAQVNSASPVESYNKTVSLIAGISQFDLSGTGTAPVVGVRADMDLNRWFIGEVGLSAMRPQEQFGQRSAPPIDAQAADGGRIGISVYTGAMRSAYDGGGDGARGGPIVGVTVGRPTTDRSSVFANFAYARSHDVASHSGSDYFRYNDTYRMATLGAEYAVLAGKSSVWLSLEGGARWRRTLADGRVGNPLESERGSSAFSVGELVVPGISFRRQIVPRGAIAIGLRDYIMSLESVKHSPGFTLGLTLR